MESLRRFSNAVRPGRRSSHKYTVNSNGPASCVDKIDANIKETEEQEIIARMALDERCIEKQGYLVKSPLRDRLRNKIARWHLRWFVLYDTFHLRCNDNDDDNNQIENASGGERRVELIYYKNHSMQNNNNPPIGRVSLIGAKVFAEPGGMHGYRYVINVITETRSFHLCATQKVVFDEWLIKLRAHIEHSIDHETNYPDEGYATWSSNSNNKKQEEMLVRIKSKKLRKYFKVHTEESSSPFQRFQLAAKFFEPGNEPIAVELVTDRELYGDMLKTADQLRRPRSNTSAVDESLDEGISSECSSSCSPSSSMSNSASNILSSSARSSGADAWDVIDECGFTGPTFFGKTSTTGRGLNRQISRSMGELPSHTISRDAHVPLNVLSPKTTSSNKRLHDKPTKSNAKLKKKKSLTQRLSLGASILSLR